MNPELWFLVGSQHLYGAETLRQVDSHAARIAAALDAAPAIPLPVVAKPVLATPEDIRRTLLEAEAAPQCAGLILWMHTFSPAKMWASPLARLTKPVAHLHTQFHRDLPWDRIDMDFMNLHQSAHGDREAGHLHARVGLRRKVVVGHWEDPRVLASLGSWARAAHAWQSWQGARFARLGDNMRQVAVTEGDKVEAEIQFGFSVNGYGVGDLAEAVASVSDAEAGGLCARYEEEYVVAEDLRRGGARFGSVVEAARIELGLRRFLEAGGFVGFTTTFEDLRGLRQLPGLAVQRLMAEGLGFGAEGDWKTCALLRAVFVMGGDLEGWSFMEDYTYHMEPGNEMVLGAHMLEVCPTIAAGRPSLEVHPLGIGGREDPARLVFDARPGAATNASLVDLGDGFRLVVSEVDVVPPPHPLPRLPVARAVWKCRPDFATACAGWIYAGGAHHTAFSYGVTTEMLEDFAAIAGIECVVLDGGADLRSLRATL
jgi:L-arabinose isomerase